MTLFGADAVEAYIHETAATFLLGVDPLAIDASQRLVGTTGESFAPRDCTGPAVLAVSIHLSLNAPPRSRSRSSMG